MSYRSHFERTLKAMSPTYIGLSESEREQWWLDLQNWPNPPQVDWAHLFVNMVLGCDWIQLGRFSQQFQIQRPPLTIPELNELLTQFKLGFSVPLEWEP